MQEINSSAQENTVVNREPNTATKKEKFLIGFIVLLCAAACVISLWLKYNFTLGYKVYCGGSHFCSVYGQEDFVSGGKAFVNKCMVDNADNTRALVFKDPVYKKAFIKKTDIKDKDGVCAAYADYYNERYSYACGLFINGEFFAAVSDKSVIDSAINSIVEQQVAMAGGESGEVYEHLITAEGFFSKECIVDDDTLEPLLNNKNTKELKKKMDDYAVSAAVSANEIIDYSNPKYNRFVHVAVKKTDVYEDSVPFETQYTYDDNHYSDYYIVDEYGEDGLGTYTDEVIYLNGEEYKRTNLSLSVTKQPKSELVTVGSVERPTGYEPGVASGIFSWPAPDLTVITSYWGDGRNHKGLDLAGMVSYGKPIYAADAGTVALASWGWSGGYGNCVYIDHGNGSQTRYAHCSNLNVNTGDVVAKGDLIGWAGNTGNSEGPHLHFEILINGVKVDPYPYLIGGLSIDIM